MMDLTISKDKLLQLTLRCRGAADSRAPSPILAGILLTATEGCLDMLATDLRLTISGHTEALVKQPGSVAVPAEDLLQSVKTMPDGNVRVSTNGGQLQIASCSRPRRHTLPCAPGSAFPRQVAPETHTVAVTVETVALRRLIRRTRFSVYENESQPQYSNILLDWREGQAWGVARMSATDGRRISRAEVGATCAGAGAELLSARAIAEIWRLTKDVTSETVIYRDERAVTFVLDNNVKLSAKILAVPPPPYEQVITAAIEARGPTIKLPRLTLAESLRAVSRASDTVTLSLSPGALQITGETQGSSSTDELDVSYVGEPVRVQLSAGFLLDVLDAMDDEDVSLSLATSTPVILQPTESEDTYTAVVSPIVP